MRGVFFVLQKCFEEGRMPRDETWVLQARFDAFMANPWEEWNPNQWPPRFVEGRVRRVFVTDASDAKLLPRDH